MDDYRNTRYCECLADIVEKKRLVKEKILLDHPNATDFHRYISDNNGKYKMDFIKAYNGKCAYCGVSIAIINKNEFEIDHFRNKRRTEFKTKSMAGYVENLVLACHDCNNKKSDFFIDDRNDEELNPDKGKIMLNYERDDMFYIKVSDEGRKKHDVIDFYNKLNLGGEMHRVDYLLMNMIGLQKKLDEIGSIKSGELWEAINIVREKRNLMHN